MDNPYPPRQPTAPLDSEPTPPTRETARRGRTWPLALIAALIGGAVALGGAALGGYLGEGDTTIVRETVTTTAPAATSQESLAPKPAEGALTVQEIVRRATPSTVVVTIGGRPDPLQGRVFSARSLGSGFVIDDQGHIVTNQHVIAGSTDATVTFSDGTVLEARVLGEDASTDVAVLKVAEVPGRATSVAIGDSSALQVGDPVLALGNPLGQAYTATTGIISALERVIDAPADNEVIQNAIQTDAAINQGNSGGPLFDARGEVIGINSQIATSGGGSDGIGFAVPINTVVPVVESIIEDGTAEHARIGVKGRALTPALAERLNLGDRRGVVIVDVVDGSPGEQAGLRGASNGAEPEVPRDADLITAVDGAPIEDMADVSRVVSSLRVGDTVTLTVIRDGEEQDITITLGDRPPSASERP